MLPDGLSCFMSTKLLTLSLDRPVLTAWKNYGGSFSETHTSSHNASHLPFRINHALQFPLVLQQICSESVPSSALFSTARMAPRASTLSHSFCKMLERGCANAASPSPFLHRRSIVYQTPTLHHFQRRLTPQSLFFNKLSLISYTQ